MSYPCITSRLQMLASVHWKYRIVSHMILQMHTLNGRDMVLKVVMGRGVIAKFEYFPIIMVIIMKLELHW